MAAAGQNLPLNTAQHEHALRPNESELEVKLSEFFPPKRAGGRYSDSEIRTISNLLEVRGKTGWAAHPRLYIVLRMIDGLAHMDNVIRDGHRDIWFPYQKQYTPIKLDPGANARFIRDQEIVLTKDANVEDGNHWNLSDGELEKHFETGKLLGSGGSGEVMVVVSRSNGKEYALKRTSRQKAFQMGMKYFMRELDALKDTVHLHIVKHVGSFADPNYVGFIMLPVADCNLESFLATAQHREDMQSWLWTYFGCLANALRYLHYTRQVRHKDIKPSNILVKGYKVILTDLGLAYDWGKTKELRTTTATEKYRTAKYCAPEVAMRRPTNSKSDIFSLGCVFLEIMTVLRGESVKTMDGFFSENGSSAKTFSGNPKAGFLWAQRLMSNTRSEYEDKPFVWIRKMLKENPQDRPNAKVLIESIWDSRDNSDSSTNSSKTFYGSCCDRSEIFLTKGLTSLHEAVRGLDEEELRQLLEKGADTNLKDTEGLTVLHRAAMEGLKSLVVLLLKHSSNINIDERDKDGKTALNWAAERGNKEVAEILIDSGADVHAPESVFGYTPMHTAAWFGNEGVIRLLLGKANLTTKTKQGYTAQELAKKWPREEIAQLLKEVADASVKAKETGKTPVAEVSRQEERNEEMNRASATRSAEAGTGEVRGKSPASRGQEERNEELNGTSVDRSAEAGTREVREKTPASTGQNKTASPARKSMRATQRNGGIPIDTKKKNRKESQRENRPHWRP